MFEHSYNMDIHDYQGRWERMLKLLANSKIDAEDKKNILAFGKDKLRKGVSTAATLKYVLSLYQCARWLGKPLYNTTLDDLDELFSKLDHGKIKRKDGHDYKPAGIRDYRLGLKVFYKWADKKELASGINIKRVSAQLDPATLWSEAEINLLIGAGKNMQDKALIAVLCESAGRIGEVGDMAIKDVKQGIEGVGEHEVLIMIDGKTGPRNILLIWAVPFLRCWLAEHPLKDKLDSPLWVMGKVKGGERIWEQRSYASLAHALETAALQSGVHKKFNPHLFRKSQTTLLRRRGYDKGLILQRNGWSKNSTMLSVYEALTDTDVANEERRINGQPLPKPKPQTARMCEFCGVVNPPASLKCAACGKVIDQDERERRLMAGIRQQIAGQIVEILPALMKALSSKKVKELRGIEDKNVRVDIIESLIRGDKNAMGKNS